VNQQRLESEDSERGHALPKELDRRAETMGPDFSCTVKDGSRKFATSPPQRRQLFPGDPALPFGEKGKGGRQKKP